MRTNWFYSLSITSLNIPLCFSKQVYLDMGVKSLSQRCSSSLGYYCCMRTCSKWIWVWRNVSPVWVWIIWKESRMIPFGCLGKLLQICIRSESILILFSKFQLLVWPCKNSSAFIGFFHINSCFALMDHFKMVGESWFWIYSNIAEYFFHVSNKFLQWKSVEHFPCYLLPW